MPKVAEVLGPLAVSRLANAGLHPVGGVAGLSLQVTPTGARSWVLRTMVGTKRREIGLGSYPGTSVGEARTKASAVRDAILNGIDPVEQRKAARARLIADQVGSRTFEQCAAAYIDAHAAGWKNAKHAAQWSTTLETYAFPVIGGMNVAAVEREHVLAVLQPIWSTKTETATRLRSRLELVLSYSMQAGHRPEGLNPARWRGGLDKLLPPPNKIAPVQHFAALPVAEVGAFMERLRAVGGQGARALEFAILTAARSGEVRGATWSEIDLDAGVWTVPAARMKAGKEHRVPLSTAAVALLKAQHRIDGNDLVFPAPRGGELSDMSLTAVLRRMEVQATAHGFRSTFRDWCAEHTNYPRDMAEMALAHALDNKVEAAYRRGDMLEKRRQMMEAWARYVGRPQRSGQVVPLRRAG